MEEPHSTRCKHCNVEIKYGHRLASKKGKCPKCRKAVLLPETDEAVVLPPAPSAIETVIAVGTMLIAMGMFHLLFGWQVIIYFSVAILILIARRLGQIIEQLTYANMSK